MKNKHIHLRDFAIIKTIALSMSKAVYLVNVILAFRICSSEDSTPSVELADKSCLRYADCLLFHRLVNT